MKSQDIRRKFVDIEQELKNVLVERSDPIRGLSLAILSGANVLYLGPPGVAKSMLVREWTKRISDGKYFEWLITPHSTPDELLGPISFTGLKEDKHERVTANKISEADLAYLDEIFKGQGVLNCLLSILNERIFFNGPQPQKIPLYSVIASSNEIPDNDDGLDAIYDRFQLKYMVSHIHEASNFVSMLKLNTNAAESITKITHDEIKYGQQEIQNIPISDSIYSIIYDISAKLRNEGVFTSDRTYKICINIIKAEAWLNNHDEVEEEDLEVIKHVLWHDPEKERKTVNKIVMEMVNPVKNEIIEVYDAAMSLLNTIDAPTANITDIVKKSSLAINELQKLRKRLVKEARSTDLIDEKLAKLNDTWSTAVKNAVNYGATHEVATQST